MKDSLARLRNGSSILRCLRAELSRGAGEGRVGCGTGGLQYPPPCDYGQFRRRDVVSGESAVAENLVPVPKMLCLWPGIRDATGW